ncbi:MAG: T9SS type A sorting domain-containing protein, partial [Bacteroidota bacterium]
FAQGIDCSTAMPFCTDSAFTYPAGVNVPSLGGVSCLSTTYNPAWFYCTIDQPGSVNIFIQNLGGHDVDFVCWGPFQSLQQACMLNLITNSSMDCSYSVSSTETCNIPNGQTGQVYVMLVTNFSNLPDNISFTQSGGTGTLDCSYLGPQSVFADHTIKVCANPASVSASPGFDHYQWSNGDTTAATTITASGSYYITATFNGIPRYDTIHVNLTSPYLNLNLGHDTTICSNTGLILDAGNAFASYQWNTGSANQAILVSTSGIYYVVASDTGQCIYNDSIKVIINPAQSLHIGNDTSLCHYNPLQLDAGLSFDSYHWSTGDTTRFINVNSNGLYSVTVNNSQCGVTDYDTIMVLFMNVPTANAGSDQFICQGSIGLLQASGGGTYVWNPVSNVSCPTCATTNTTPAHSTTYTVTVTASNGCKATDSVTIHVANAILSTISTTCGLSNGSVTVYPYGGSGSYSYLWNTTPTQNTQSITGITGGQYNVTITDNNYLCSFIKSVNVYNQPPPSISVIAKYNSSCGYDMGGMLVHVNEGLGPFTYIWNSDPPQTSKDLLNVPAGVYCVTVTDAHNCMDTVCDTIINSPKPTPSICLTTVDTATNHNLIMVDNIGFTAVTGFIVYKDTSGAMDFDSIGFQYYVDGTIFTDTTSDASIQSERYKISLLDSCGIISDLSEANATIFLSVNYFTGTQSKISWNYNGSNQVAGYRVYRGTSLGNLSFLANVYANYYQYYDYSPPSDHLYYMVEAVLNDTCNPLINPPQSFSSSFSNIVNAYYIGLDENNLDLGIRIYPNPAKETLTLELTSTLNAPTKFEVCDLLGRKMMEQNIANLKTQIDVSSLAKGMYLLKLKCGNKIQTKRFVKE